MDSTPTSTGLVVLVALVAAQYKTEFSSAIGLPSGVDRLSARRVKLNDFEADGF
jgi:hypothetical protein